MEIDGVEKLIAKSNNDEITYFIAVDEIYDGFTLFVLLIYYWSRWMCKLRKEIGKKYAKITIFRINFFYQCVNYVNM